MAESAAARATIEITQAMMISATSSLLADVNPSVSSASAASMPNAVRAKIITSLW